MLVYSDPDAAKVVAQNYPGLVSESLITGLEVVALTQSDPIISSKHRVKFEAGDQPNTSRALEQSSFSCPAS